VTVTTSQDRSLRADAERNRLRILKAAQKAFAKHGLDVPMEDVAEGAGVGIATVYRRFPTRDDLIAACFEQRIEEYAHAAEEALEAPDGWSGFRGYVERICGMQAADRGLKDVMTRSFPDAKTLEAHRRRGYELSVRVIARAQAEGTLRSDLVPEDLVLLLIANAAVVEATAAVAPDAPRRLVALLLDGMRSEGSSELPPAPSPRRMVRAMRGLRGRGTR
jgi:AcrR family transcriptional regulator